MSPGNFRSTGFVGGLRAGAETMLPHNYDGYFSNMIRRAGGFEPAALLPRQQRLWWSAHHLEIGELEKKDDIKRRSKSPSSSARPARVRRMRLRID